MVHRFIVYFPYPWLGDFDLKPIQGKSGGSNPYPWGPDHEPQLFREAADSEYGSWLEYSGFQIILDSAPSSPRAVAMAEFVPGYSSATAPELHRCSSIPRSTDTTRTTAVTAEQGEAASDDAWHVVPAGYQRGKYGRGVEWDPVSITATRERDVATVFGTRGPGILTSGSSCRHAFPSLRTVASCGGCPRLQQRDCDGLTPYFPGNPRVAKLVLGGTSALLSARSGAVGEYRHWPPAMQTGASIRPGNGPHGLDFPCGDVLRCASPR